jgi:HNH endonuclease
MSVTYISADLRRLVAARADRLCEYCLIAEDDTVFGCAVDHVISEKHGGPTEEGNLAYACVFCNRAEGSDIGSLDWVSGEFVRFFNPRTDRWTDHFVLAADRIEPQTPFGRATARILNFNSMERVLERAALREVGRYPSPEALRRMLP